jgi:long-chain acyl-CoA synthetase
MTNDAANARGPSASAMPWLRVYPPNIPAEAKPPRYRLLGESAPDLAARRGDAKAFTTVMPNGMGGSLSFAEVDRLSDAFATYLREGLRLNPGSRVAIQMPNGLAYPIVAFGVFKAGCILVNVNPLYTATEMAHVFADAKPAAIVAIDMFADKLAAAMQTAPIRHVILSEAASLFPAYARLIIGSVQKYVRKQIPRPRFAAVPFAQALATGAQKIRLGADVRAYAAGLEPAAVACLQYTGGTTGISKGAMLTHANLLHNVEQFLAFQSDGIAQSDHVLTALPLYHIFAFTVNMFGFFFVGAHNLLIPSPRPLVNLRPAFEKYPVTAITGVNTLYNGLLNEAWFSANPPRRLRTSFAGGMALHPVVAQKWEETTGIPLHEGYGLSEASPVLTANPTAHAKLGTIGVPMPWTEIKCVDDDGREVAPGEHGELIARGPQIMAGYWNQPEETRIALRDGWLYTGDIATMDRDGYFSIVDRNQVEEVLSQHPGVKECAVIGVRDECSGEAVKAFIVRNDNALDADAVRAFCRTQLAGYKVPKTVAFRDDLPKSAVGKILRRDLRK